MITNKKNIILINRHHSDFLTVNAHIFFSICVHTFITVSPSVNGGRQLVTSAMPTCLPLQRPSIDIYFHIVDVMSMLYKTQSRWWCVCVCVCLLPASNHTFYSYMMLLLLLLPAACQSNTRERARARARKRVKDTHHQSHV